MTPVLPALAALLFAGPAAPEAPYRICPEVHPAVEAFPLEAVRLGDGPCRRAQEADRRYLHFLDLDRLLYTFRQNAGLPTPGKPLGGWESPSVEVRGHFVGHYLSACALMVAGTGDEKLKEKADRLVHELGKCQQALGGEYLSAFPESYLDRLERMDHVTWAPLYVIHKLMAGMYDMFRLTGNREALDILKRMAAYYRRRTDRLSDYQMERMLTVEFGGMSEVLHNLYGVTGDPADLALAHRFDQAAFLGPLALGRDNLTGLHGNTQLPKILGAARHYELTGDPLYRKIVTFFWDRVVDTRCYATGGTTSAEHWPEPYALADTLSATNQECCKTHNLLKITRYLIRWTADPRYADYYERAFFNGILGTQRPDTGMMLYYVPLGTGFTKRWGTPYDSFWCCYGTGIESFAKLGDSIYFHSDNAVYVNLYIASTVRWKEKGLRLEQVTRFPEEEGSTFRFQLRRPVRLSLCLHVPCWATAGVRVSVNGKEVRQHAEPTSYLRLERTWRDGDTVRLHLPMRLHPVPMPDDPELVAVMYGPVVVAGLSPDPEAYFVADPKHPEQWIERLDDRSLTFRTRKGFPSLRFIPLNQVMDQPYGVYWRVVRPDSPTLRALQAEAEKRRQREERTVDQVVIGDKDSEREHNLQGERTADGPFGIRHWRHAVKGGWWSWDLAILPDQPMILSCTYWGSDTGHRAFDLVVDGKRVATQVLDRNAPGRFFTVDYPLPAELTRGKKRVTIRFQAHPDSLAGGVFECRTLRAEK